jgi:hypothetical protein
MAEKLSLPLVPREASALVSTLCKFVVAGFRSKKEHLSAEVILCSQVGCAAASLVLAVLVLTWPQRKAGRFLKNRPSGSYILRLAKDALIARKTTPLFISVKVSSVAAEEPAGLRGN